MGYSGYYYEITLIVDIYISGIISHYYILNIIIYPKKSVGQKPDVGTPVIK